MTAPQKKARLRKLNGDTTWLLQIPLSERKTYNLLVDPWLSTSRQVDYHPLFSAQTRIEAASFPSITALSTSLANETLEAAARDHHGAGTTSEGANVAGIDAILISHPFSDHAHPETLSELLDQTNATYLRPIDVFCTPQSHKALTALLKKHVTSSHRQMFKLHLLDEVDKRATDLDAVVGHKQDSVPAGIRLLRLPAQESAWTHGPAWPDLHSAVALVWDKSAVVYSPHGVLQSSIPRAFAQAQSRTLIQAFDRQTLPLLSLMTGPVALGFHQAALSCFQGQGYQPTLILRTHDEHKTARGLVGKIIAREETSDQAAREALDRLGDIAARDCRVRSLGAGEAVEVGGNE